MNLSPLPIQKFFDNNGKPLVGGLLFTYEAGTSVKIDTYTDAGGGSLNTNPIVLDYRGECRVWLDITKTYKFILTKPGDTDPPTDPIWTVDNISVPIGLIDLTQQIIGEILYPQTASEAAAGVTPTRYWYPPGNVLRYGADPTGVSASDTAINMADAGACLGTTGLDGVTVVSEGIVTFPAGTYKVSGTLYYRGAPWQGEGVDNTFINFTASSGACVNAVGTNTARKLLSISDMTFNGSSASGTAYALRIGYNQRSMAALRRVRIDSFPGPAIYFAEPTWSMTFYEVYCSFNAADSLGTAIYIDPALVEGTLLACDWYGLQLENNGYTGSGVGGGIHLPSNAIYSWKFYGGVWEGNYGLAEAVFIGVNQVHINGLYLESESASVAHGLVFDDTYGSVTNMHLSGQSGMTGNGLYVTGTSVVNVEQVHSNINWLNDIALEDTARVMLSGINAMLEFSVANGAVLDRVDSNRQQLTDAATIATDAAQANSFYVTLFDHRTMGEPTNPSIGQQITYTIIQNNITGSCTLGWNAVFKQAWSDTGNTTGKRSSIVFEYDGTNWNQVGAQSPYI